MFIMPSLPLVLFGFSICEVRMYPLCIIVCALMGFGTGFWAIFVTMAAEQFGTNIRATVATTVPNMVRGSLTLVSLLFTQLQRSVDYVTAGWITGIVVMIIGIVSVVLAEETFHKDLNYLEGEIATLP